MLTLVNILASTLAALAAAAQAPADPGAGATLSRNEAEAALRNCDQRRFQSVAEALVDGQKKRATIQLCAKPSDTNAQWAATLEKSAAQIAASPQITAESKARLREEFAAAVTNARAGRLPDPVATASGSTGLSGVIASPGLQPRVNRPPSTPPVRAADRLESNVPPLPAPLPPKPAGSRPGLLAELLAQPQITVRCLASGEGGRGSECDEIRNNTTLLVRAEESFPSSAALRFVRSGDARAEVDLGAMRKGEVRRIRVPNGVCRGVVRSELELNTVVMDPKTRSEQMGRAIGPVTLRCF